MKRGPSGRGRTSPGTPTWTSLECQTDDKGVMQGQRALEKEAESHQGLKNVKTNTEEKTSEWRRLLESHQRYCDLDPVTTTLPTTWHQNYDSVMPLGFILAQDSTTTGSKDCGGPTRQRNQSLRYFATEIRGSTSFEMFWDFHGKRCLQ